MNKNHEEHEVKYRFTKYLETAVKRTRNHYIIKEIRRAEREENTAEADGLPVHESIEPEAVLFWSQHINYLPLDVDVIRRNWNQYTEGNLNTAVMDLNDKEIMVLFAKVYWELDFTEIGVLLFMDAKKVSNIYSYIRKKLKKGGVRTNGI